MHNKCNKLGNKHVKDILYAICSNHLISEYNIYIHYKYLNVNIDIKSLGYKAQFPTNSHLLVILIRHTFDSIYPKRDFKNSYKKVLVNGSAKTLVNEILTITVSP